MSEQRFLMIQNPGVAPSASFTLLGASTKRNADSEMGLVGTFGSGNKHGVAVLIRHGLSPTVFAGNLKMTFDTRPEKMKGHTFKRVVVKFGGKDTEGKTRNSTEDLGYVLDYGASDWDHVDMACREFISNSLDQVVEDGEKKFKNDYFLRHAISDEYDLSEEQRKIYRNELKAYRLNGVKQDYQNVIIEIVEENQVRAKTGYTRVFIPLNEEVEKFYTNIGKWFLHFSEPDNVNKEVLFKNNRNLGDNKVAVIYRRGVRVREIQSEQTPSLFDYNLRDIPIDESRKIDDWRAKTACGQALVKANRSEISAFWQSYFTQKCWEQSFSQYSLSIPTNFTQKEREEIKKNWAETFETVLGNDAIVSTKNGGEIAARKGYKVIQVSDEMYEAVKNLNIKTPDQVLTQDEKEGRVILDPSPDAICAVDFIWKLLRQYNLLNGKEYPVVKGFSKAMDAGSQLLGFYRAGTVYLNCELGNNASEIGGYKALSHQMLQTALEEVGHHVTGEADFSRGFQDFFMNLAIRLAVAMNE